jgi:hypothetical protein
VAARASDGDVAARAVAGEVAAGATGAFVAGEATKAFAKDTMAGEIGMGKPTKVNKAKQHLGRGQRLRRNFLQKRLGGHQLKSLGRENPSEHQLELVSTVDERQQEEKTPWLFLGCLGSLWWMTGLRCSQGLLDIFVVSTSTQRISSRRPEI